LNPFIRTPVKVFRTLFLSDFHIGAKGFDGAALHDFLKSTQSETLYLVGDIIDGWKLSKRWHWTEDCTRVLDELARKAHEGTKIIYLPGNHDESVRAIPLFQRMRFARRMNISIRNTAMHRTADGRKLLVLHGDQFDKGLLRGPLPRWSDRAYDMLSDLMGRHETPQTRFSLAKFLGRHGQRALNVLNRFEGAVFRMVKDKGADGLICGHTHIPALKHMRGIMYGNCGSWLGHGHTAIAEDMTGNLGLIDWPSTAVAGDQTADLPHTYGPVRIFPDSSPFRPATEDIIHAIRKTWPTPKRASSRDIPIYAAGMSDASPMKAGLAAVI